MCVRDSVVRPVLLAALGAVAIACGDRSPTAPAAGTRPASALASRGIGHRSKLTWQLVSGIGAGQTPSVWAASPTDVWAAGGYRILVHYDGTSWKQATLPYASNQYEVWGLGPNDVYTVGQYGYQTGQVLHWDGTSWTSMFVTNDELFAIWGTAPNNLYVVGDGRLVHYDGTTWTDIPTGLSTAFKVDRLEGVWGDFSTRHGVARPDVWMVGFHGRIMHYDGTSVATAVELPSETFHAIHGTSWKDIFAVGSHGMVWHFDGSTWSRMNSGTSAELSGVFAISRHDVWVAGDGGALLHYDGHTWAPVNSGTTVMLGQAFALSRDQLYLGTTISQTEGGILVGSATY